MDSFGLPVWLQATISAAGGLGLFVVAFLDSVAVPLPSVSDLLLIDLSIKSPLRMPYYALMTTIGSVIGCLVLYFVARAGGEAYFRKHGGARAERIHKWVARNGFLTMLIGALAPPPTPFKGIVIAAGALEMPLRTFTIALILARLIRFFGEGYLAIRYGEQAKHILEAHIVLVSVITIGAIVVFYGGARLILRPAKKAVQ
ncbi:MAG TPA: VTT domain-containing protein [Candidatus Limnocylindrales bacterium]|nr:VTT domain-containing protein [Candidatus Limnocylindrales bacterium]